MSPEMRTALMLLLWSWGVVMLVAFSFALWPA